MQYACISPKVLFHLNFAPRVRPLETAMVGPASQSLQVQLKIENLNNRSETIEKYIKNPY